MVRSVNSLRLLEIGAALAIALGWLGAGVAGLTRPGGPFGAYAAQSLLLGGAAMLLLSLELSYRPSGRPWPAATGEPRHLTLGPADHIKALICWVHAFKHTYALEPGLYFTGARCERDQPLLVSCN